jgi:D-ribose pyranase
MKKTTLMNHRLSDAIARIGHTQRLVVGDAGLPIPFHVDRIDLAVSPGVPGVMDVLRAIASEMQVEAIVVADELLARDETLAADVCALFPGAPLSSVPHAEFKQMSESAIAVVRTAECTPYANFMLISGVTY